jgi:DNA (cytosine-5)-methyltransferase 1
MKPRLLDLYCAAGGAGMGYHRAGFDVVGVDILPQPNYPFEFQQMDALKLLEGMVGTPDNLGFDAIHASPPCQAYSSATPQARKAAHPDLYLPTRELLIETGLPYVIENVIGAPYSHGVILCGSMFDMRIRRHRNFEASWMLFQPACQHEGRERPFTITGNGGLINESNTKHSRQAPYAMWPELMGMPWATPAEVKLAIPPAYTEWIGRQLIGLVGERAA